MAHKVFSGTVFSRKKFGQKEVFDTDPDWASIAAPSSSWVKESGAANAWSIIAPPASVWTAL